jgi:hypothetical protein
VNTAPLVMHYPSFACNLGVPDLQGGVARWLRSVASAAFACAQLLCVPALLAAQGSETSVVYRPPCSTCIVEFAAIATLGSTTDPQEISQYTSIDRDSQGRYYAFSDYSQVLVYDQRGRFLQTIGRSGSGPGELGSMMACPGTNTTRSSISQVSIGSGDTIIVFHGLNISLFSPTFEFVRRISVTPVGTSLHSLSRLSDGRWLLGGDFRREPSHAGRSIHIADASGRVTRSIGPDAGLQPGRGAYLFPSTGFKLDPSGETVWFTRGYSLERWRLSDSVPEVTIGVREVPWLEGTAEAGRAAGPRLRAPSAGTFPSGPSRRNFLQ